MAIEYPVQTPAGILLSDTVVFALPTASNGDLIASYSSSEPILTSGLYMAVTLDQVNSGGTAASAGFQFEFQHTPGGDWNLAHLLLFTSSTPKTTGQFTIADLNGAGISSTKPVTIRATPGGVDSTAAAYENSFFRGVVYGARVTYFEADNFTAGIYQMRPILLPPV